MKKNIQFTWILLLLPCWAYNQTYHLTVTSEPYVDLVGGTPAVTQSWDDPGYDVPIGFLFHFYNQNITTVHQLANIAFPILASNSVGDTLGLFLVFGADLIDRGFADTLLQSPITYKTTGSPGQRVFTIEWKNAGFYRQYFFTGNNTDFVNFQMQLYEDSGDIVYRFGPSVITQPELDYDSTGAFVGLVEKLMLSTDVSIGQTLLLTGNPASPTVVQSYLNVYMNGTIPQNTVYTFSREVSATDQPVSNENLTYFTPTPCRDFISATEMAKEEIVPPVYFFDSTGSLLKKEEQFQTITTDKLPPGMYQLQFQTKHGLKSQRIIVLQ